MVFAALLVALTALACKLPFLNFPMDEDFAFYTYLARFQTGGLKMKRDFLILFPAWRGYLINLVYGKDPENGTRRIRLFLAACHIATSLVAFWAAYRLTDGNGGAALAAGMLYALFGTVPALSAHSVNMEQIYPACMTAGMVLFLDGRYELSGLLFGAGIVAKIWSGIYVPPLALVAWHEAGIEAALVFCVAGSAPLLMSTAADMALGFIDAEAREQARIRFANGMTLPKLKRMYGSHLADFKAILGETLPVWVIGFPAALLSPLHPFGLPLALYAFITVLMIVCQLGYSRYHYLPAVLMLSIAAGAGLGYAGPFTAGLLAALLVSIALTARQLWPYYRHPLDTHTLARYDKFDQYIYLPRLGKALQRLMDMKKENGRLFVWGNYIQVYFHTGRQATDKFLHYALGPWEHEMQAGYFDTVIGGLMEHRPRYVIKTFPDFDMRVVAEITGLEYRLMKVWRGRFPVYRLVAATAPHRDPLALDWREKLALFARVNTGAHAPGVMADELDALPLRAAIKECRKLVRLNRHDADGLFQLHLLYERAGIADERLAVLIGRLVGERPGQKGARLILARHDMKRGNAVPALLLLEEEERLFGIGASTLFTRGHLLLGMGKPEKAADAFGALRARDGANAEWALYHAESLLAAGRKTEAKETFLAAWDRGANAPRWIRTRAALGVAAIDAPRTPEHDTLQSFIGKDGGNEQLVYACASALEKAGRADAARKAFAAIAELSGTDDIKGAALYRLARLSSNGEKETLAARCLKLAPHHKGARELLRNG